MKSLIKSIKSLAILILAICVSTVVTSSVRTRGRFDRFGSGRNLHKAISYRSPDSELYYHHPDCIYVTKHIQIKYYEPDTQTTFPKNYRNRQELGKEGNKYTFSNGARIMKSSNFEMDYELGRKIVFLCTAIGNPRPTITWFKDGIELEVHSWYRGWRSITEWKESNERVKSKMEIDPAAAMDRGEYECVADNKWALDRRRFRTEYVETQNPYFT